MTTYSRRSFVVGRIRRLLGNDPGRLSPAATAQLAQLRHALGKEPGSVPQVWATTLDGLPEGLGAMRRAREELAIHLALTHFAFHQQSKPHAMHDGERAFGTAIRHLADQQSSGTNADPHETPAYQRFLALASTRQLTATSTHARGLISQLRAADLGFDYGRFVDDLYWLQIPGQAIRVQRGWGRDFHRLPTDNSALASIPEGDPT